MGKKDEMKRGAMIFLVVMILVLGTFPAIVLGGGSTDITSVENGETTPVIMSNEREVEYKTFYMYQVRDAVSVGGRTTKEVYNTTYPVGTGNATDPSQFKIIVDWFLYPALAGDLTLDGESTLTVWVKANMPDTKDMYYTLTEVDAEGNEYPIATSGAVSRGISTDWGTATISINIDNYTVSKGSTLMITYLLWGDAMHSYEVAYGGIVEGDIRDTNVTLPCRDYIEVSNVYTTDHQGNVTNIFSPEAVNKTIYIHANVTNPFGGYDIKWVNVTLQGPGGNIVINMEAMDKVYGYFNSFESRYLTQWNYSGEPDGNYNVTVRAVDNTGLRMWNLTGDFGGHEEYGYHDFVIGGLDHYVNLKIFDDQENILPNVTVLLKISDTVVFSVNSTDHEGITNFTVAEVTYIISIMWQDMEVGTNRTLDVGEVGNRTRDNPYNLTAGVFYPSFLALDMEGVPVETANVYLRHPNGTARIQPIVTDSDGKFALEQTAEGIYNLEVFWKGRAVGTFDIDVGSSGEYAFNTHIYHLTIVVLDDSGMPLSNALVVSSYNDTMIVAESRLTDPDGELSTRLPATEYFIEIYWNDAKVHEDTYLLNASGVLTIYAGIYETNVTVVDTLDQPLSGAEVTAIYTSTGREIDTIRTDENGTVNFQLAIGEHLFVVTWLGVEVANELFVVNETHHQFEITADVYYLNITTIDGTEDNNVLVDATILIRINQNLVDTGATDENGSYVVRLPGASVDIEVEWKGVQVNTTEGYLVDSNHDLTMICDVYYVSILVTDSMGEPLAEAGVTAVYSQTGTEADTGSTGADGIVNFRLAVGEYRFDVTWMDVGVASEIFMVNDTHNQFDITADVYYLNIITIDGTEDQNALVDASIFIRISQNLVDTGTTDGDGSYVSRLPGAYVDIEVEWKGVQVHTFDNYLVDHNHELTIVCDVYYVTIQVTDTMGEPLEDADVTSVYNHTDTEADTGRTGTDGMANFRLPLGEYRFDVTWMDIGVASEIFVVNDTHNQFDITATVYYLDIITLDGTEDQNVLVGATVLIRISQNLVDTGTTDGDGSYVSRIPGAYVDIEVEWKGVQVHTIDNYLVDSNHELIIVCDVYYVSILITDSTGVPLEDADVTSIYNLTDTEADTGRTDADGMVNFRLAAAEYRFDVVWMDVVVASEIFVVNETHNQFDITATVYYLDITTLDGTEDQNPLVDATVLIRIDLNLVDTGTTDGDGSYVSRLPGAYVDIEVEWKGVIVHTTVAYLVDSNHELTIICEVYYVSILVTDSTGEPLSQADVTAFYSETDTQADGGRTTAGGMVNFRMAATEYRFDVNWMDVRVASEFFTVSATHNQFEITADVYYLGITTLDGTVDGNPLVDATVTIRINQNLVYTGVTDEDGSYVARLPGAYVDIEVEWRSVLVHTSEDYLVDSNHELTIVCDVYYIDMLVVDSMDEPVEGVSIIIELEGVHMLSAMSDGDGFLRARLPVENYVVQARWYGVQVLEEEFSVISEPGANELVLRCNIYYLTISVVDAEEKPLSATVVELYLEEDLLFSTVTGTDGMLTVRLPQETFDITFTWRGFFVADTVVTTDLNREISIDAAVYHISFTPVDSIGEILYGADIRVSHNNDTFERGNITKQGNFTLRLPEEEYRIEVRWQGVKVMDQLHNFSMSEEIDLHCDVYYLTISGTDSRDVNVEGLVVTIYHTSLPEGQDLITTTSIDETPTVRLPFGTVRLEGEWQGFLIADEWVELSDDLEFELMCDIYYLDVDVVDSEGVSLDGADLVLKDTAGTVFVAQVTDMGTATPRLPHGTWTLEAYWRGYHVGTVVTDLLDEDVDIRLETAVHYLRVTVEGQDGEPIPGVELTLLDAGGVPQMSLETGEDGKVVFAQIVEGDYTLVGSLKTTQLMTDIDLEETEEVGLHSSQDILLTFDEYPRAIYRTNLFYTIMIIVAIIVAGMVAIARKKEVF